MLPVGKEHLLLLLSSFLKFLKIRNSFYKGSEITQSKGVERAFNVCLPFGDRDSDSLVRGSLHLSGRQVPQRVPALLCLPVLPLFQDPSPANPCRPVAPCKQQAEPEGVQDVGLPTSVAVVNKWSWSQPARRGEGRSKSLFFFFF